MPTARQTPRTPLPAIGAPSFVEDDVSQPIPDLPRKQHTGEVDQGSVLEYLWNELHRGGRDRRRLKQDHDTFSDQMSRVDEYEARIKRAQRWGGWVWGLLGAIGLVFSAGVAYSVFIGDITTDGEMDKKMQDALIEHNGVDPTTRDPATHRPVGDHPDMREAIQSNSKAIKRIDEEVLPEIIETTKKLDKRSEYQFELGRWQALTIEAERKRERPPPKPPSLEVLENDLMLGNYE